MSQKTFPDSADNRQLAITGTDPFTARAGKRREFRERLGAACDEEPSLK